MKALWPKLFLFLLCIFSFNACFETQFKYGDPGNGGGSNENQDSLKELKYLEGETISISFDDIPDYGTDSSWSYQWSLDGKVLSEEISSTLSISKLTLSHAGIYSLSLFKDGELQLKKDLKLEVTARPFAPLVSKQLVGGTEFVGNGFYFEIEVNASPAPEFRWSKNGEAVGVFEKGREISPGLYSSTLKLGTLQLSDSARFSVEIKNFAGTVFADAAELIVSERPQAPAWVQGPASQNIKVGERLTLSCEATGNPSPDWQWYKNNNPLVGQDKKVLTIESVKLSDAGRYHVQAFNDVGIIISQKVQVVVSEGDHAPVFKLQPAMGQSLTGGTHTFRAEVVAQPNASFTWKKGSNTISASTKYTISSGVEANRQYTELVVNNAQESDEGSYSVEAKNTKGSTLSDTVSFVVDAAESAPVITKAPTGGNFLVGDEIILTVEATGNPSPRFKWYKDFSAIDGATSRQLVILSAQTGDSGQYAVVVGNDVAAISSDTVQVLVVAETTAPRILSLSSSKVARAGDDVSFTVIASGEPTPTYQWRKDNVDIPGATSTTLSLKSVDAEDDGNYRVYVSNSKGNLLSDSIRLTISSTPAAVQQPSSAVLAMGAAYTLQFDANGAPSPSFQWYKDGRAISGATNKNFSIASFSDAYVGSYYAIARNTAGQIQSSTANLTLKASDSVQSKFLAAKEVMKNKCYECHGAGSLDGDYEKLNSSEAFVQGGYIVGGDLAKSDLYQALKPRGNMPKNRNPLSNAEDQIIAAWILAVESDDIPPMGSPEPDIDFACNSGDYSVDLLKRLSKKQLLNTLLDFVDFYASGSEATRLKGIIQNEMRDFPANEGFDYDNHDPNFDVSHVQVLTKVSRVLASEMIKNSSTKSALSGGCNASNDTCARAMIRNVGEKIFRHRVNSEDENFYMNEVITSLGGVADPVEAFLAVALNSPDFYHHIEGSDADMAVQSLNAYDIANRLSYHFWQSMPDAELFNKARDNSLLNANTYAAQVDRLMNHADTKKGLFEFYKGYFSLPRLPHLSALDRSPAERDFFGELNLGNRASAIEADMKQELLDLAYYHTYHSPGKMSDIYNSRLSFAQTPEVAEMYGTSAWSAGNYAAPKQIPTSIPRSGLLSRAGPNAHRTVEYRPVLRGVFIREHLLCQELELPPPGAEEEFSMNTQGLVVSTRTLFEDNASSGSCAGCHAKINPLGFASDNIDSAGRLRSQVQVYPNLQDLDQRTAFPVNTEVSPLKIWAEDLRTINGSVELNQAVASSKSAQACFGQHLFRYTYGRHEKEEQDGCELNRLKERAKNMNLKDFFKSIALDQRFKLRVTREN